MDIATFWRMIEGAREAANSDIARQTELLVEALSKESDEEIIEFDRILLNMADKAYRGDLWDACHFICCGCSDGDFMDFRAWLIAHGNDIFEKAITNPETLAHIVSEHNPDIGYEIFAYVASYAYDRKNNKDIPRIPRVHDLRLVGPTHDEEELPQLFPALMAKLGSCSEWWDKYLNND